MSTVLAKISKPELAVLISDYFRLDHDLVSCVVHEKPFDLVPAEIANLCKVRPPPGQPEGDRTEPVRRIKELTLALAAGYVYGKEAGRVL
jgi:hypothetical protein